mgnify:CR=1 FL=1
MLNSTTNTYTLKREILTFSNKISKYLTKPDRKFTADMTYGMLASGRCLLTDMKENMDNLIVQRDACKSVKLLSFLNP